MKINKLFDKPKIIGICSDVNSGKSNLIYYLISKLKKYYDFDLYTYGLRFDINDKKIYSIEELEDIRNSIVFIDEFFSLFDLEDRKKAKLIERTIRLINHNNNILVLCGLPENFRKFISNKLDAVFFGKSTLGDFINGSRLKQICLSYKGNELGSTKLNLDKGEVIFFNGNYEKVNIPYLPQYDSKKDNKPILKCAKKCSKKNVQKNSVKKNVQNEIINS